MKNKSLLILNTLTIIAFVLYGIGIILYTLILDQRWGNAAIDLGIQILGPILGTIIVLLIEIGILISSYYLSKLNQFSTAINVFLCWFWIFSLYQCAINTFLSINNLPNEPINLFFKTIWPLFWYPIKELVFIGISIILTYIWFIKIEQDENITKYDFFLIFLIIISFWLTIAASQISLINKKSNVYS
ncbi:MAG: hypothetical protein GF353_20630 [Candidatus Lokiarchaeota archaeon]|nr:hypothetical protein [Candidatus Lokiarchaeota archaeon]